MALAGEGPRPRVPAVAMTAESVCASSRSPASTCAG